jgi:hypothetical protein
MTVEIEHYALALVILAQAAQSVLGNFDFDFTPIGLEEEDLIKNSLRFCTQLNTNL